LINPDLYFSFGLTFGDTYKRLRIQILESQRLGVFSLFTPSIYEPEVLLILVLLSEWLVKS
jgi:hypothetical protein